MNKPIIESLLSTDFYKGSVSNCFFVKGYSNTPVAYEFRNRSSLNLNQYVDIGELREQIEATKQLSFTQEEINFLAKQGIFDEGWLEALKTFKLSNIIVEPAEKDFFIQVEGDFMSAMWWETIILSIVNELYFYGACAKHNICSIDMSRCFMQNTKDKANVLRQYPGIKFVEFGTRRRATHSLQGSMIAYFANVIPEQMLGTSNMYWAMHFGLPAKGTFGHEAIMAYSAIYRDQLRDSQNIFLRDWYEVYGESMSIALNDTWGTKIFWDGLTEEQAHQWRGWREDSGNIFEWIPYGIEALRKNGVDAREKICMPSDGLTIEKMIEIHEAFHDKVKLVFGVGTHLSFDFGETVKPVSIVVKMTECNNLGVVKLSNNISKAIGNPEDLELFKRTFGYTSEYREECKV